MNMLNVLNEINWLEVGLASLGVFILGGLWFTIFFGKPYAASLGREFDPKEKPVALFIVGPLICTIIKYNHQCYFVTGTRNH